MPPTLLTDPARFDGHELTVDGDAYRHLFRSLRLAAGDRVRVADGAGRARWAAVARVDRSAGILSLGEPAPANEPAVRVELLVPTLRPERAAWLVEKITEVGVFAVRFLHMERAPRTFGSGSLERLRRVAVAAVEQCHRARVPEITGVHEWGELERLAAASPARAVLDPEAPIGALPAGSAESTESVALLVGPEGGLTPAERERAAALGFRPVGLGPRVLRIETAAVVGAALLLVPPGV